MAYIIRQKYLFAIFGYDAYSKEYIDTIEYIDLLNKNSKWEYFKYKNNFNIFEFLTNIIVFPFHKDKILLLGGFNNKKEINEYYKIDLELFCENLKEISTIEKYKHNMIFNDNKKEIIFDCNLYRFYGQYNNICYGGFDQDLKIHIFNERNFCNEIYSFK